MSNVLLPVALLRPSCLAAVRCTTPSASQEWKAVAATIARHLSSSSKYRNNQFPALQCRNSVLQNHIPQFQFRSFTQSLTPRASVSKPSTHTPPASEPKKKRQIRIGPLPCGEVSPKTIESIFGSTISPADGNGCLRILHHRRVSGSLADYGVDNLSNKFRNMTPELAMKGLEWLRQAFPVDEARAAEEWAEKEANRIAYELWLAEEQGGKAVSNPEQVWKEMKEEEKMQQRQYQTTMLHHGPSVLEQSIKEKRKKRLEEATKRAEEKEAKEAEEAKLIASGEYIRSPGGTALIKPGQTTYVDIFGKEVVDRRKEWSDYYNKKAATPFKSEEEMRNAQTPFQRLMPSTLLGLAIYALCYLFASTYVPPAEEFRLWPEFSPPVATLSALFLANFSIYCLWRHKPIWPFMTRYFMNVPGSPRPMQIILNSFSHVQTSHLFANMLWVLAVGYLCHELVGRGQFLGTYFASAVTGSLFTAYCANFGLAPLSIHSMGASAAMYGVTSLYLLLTQQQTIKLPFIKDAEVGFWPKALWLVVLAIEVRSFVKKGRWGKGEVDHASHLGGMVMGAGVAGWVRWREGRGFGEELKGEKVDVVGILKEEADEIKGVVKAVGKGERSN